MTRFSKCARFFGGTVIGIASTFVAASEPRPPVEAVIPTPCAAGHRWESSRECYDGPVLDAEWFGDRRVVVYLVPQGGLPAMRGPAAEVIRSRWTAGDWSLKHIFVSSVASRAVFLAGRRIGLHDLAQSVTKEAGQSLQFVSENEDFVRQNVFFVHDPDGTAWSELLGSATGEPGDAAIILLKDGTVTKVLRPADCGRDGDDAAIDGRIAAEVRDHLPAR